MSYYLDSNIVIEVSGGIIQEIHHNTQYNFVIIDYDNDPDAELPEGLLNEQ